jgi:hypothetical protein
MRSIIGIGSITLSNFIPVIDQKEKMQHEKFVVYEPPLPVFILTCEYLYLHVSFLVDLIEKEVIKHARLHT